MDLVSAHFDGPRARGAFLLRTVMNPPWSMRIEDRSPLAVVAVTRGDACIVRNRKRYRLVEGDVALISGPMPYTVGDSPATPPQILIQPGQVCTTLRGEDLAMSMHLGVRTWGNSSLDGRTVMLVGTYEHTSALSGELLGSLPPVAVVHAGRDSTLVGLLSREIVRDSMGQQTFLDRLLDLITVDTMRAWYELNEAHRPAWWTAHHDPIVGHALRLLHDEPSDPWTIAGLAAAVGVSRANLARRFGDFVGEPPMTYLTKWRLSLAADLLANPTLSVNAVARQVGYGSQFAFSTAFKRRFNESPQRFRQAFFDNARRAG